MKGHNLHTAAYVESMQPSGGGGFYKEMMMTNKNNPSGDESEALDALEALSKAIFDRLSTRSPAEIQDDIETIKAALTAQQPEDKWQPIETAPKDETSFLALVKTENEPYWPYVVMQVAYFQGEFYPDHLFANVDESDSVRKSMVAWKPLPAPPKA